MRDIDRVQSMNEPPRRPPDQRTPRRSLPQADEEPDPATAERAPEPEPERVGNIDLRV